MLFLREIGRYRVWHDLFNMGYFLKALNLLLPQRHKNSIGNDYIYADPTIPGAVTYGRKNRGYGAEGTGVPG